MATRTSMPLPFIDADEYDALSAGKKYHSYRPGERKRIKRQYQRRVRRTMNEATKEEAGQ